MKHILTIALALVVTGTLVVAQNARSPEVLFKAAQHAEEVQGDLKAAIQQYKKVIDAGSRPFAARALVRMAECYQKMGDAQSRIVYERVVREFPDQAEQVALAQSRLGRERADGQRAIALRKVWADHVVGDDTRGAVSIDGRYLTYAGHFNTAVILRDLRTGVERPLTTGDSRGTFASAISKDGTQVAYNSCTRENCELRVAALQGNGIPPSRTVLANDEVFIVTPLDWSPDGKWIAASLQRKDRTAQIGLVPASGGSMRVLKSVDWRVPTRGSFSPDGRDIAFDLPASDTAEERDVFVLASDGSREIPAVVNPGNDVVIGWSPDGAHLLFASDRSGTMGLWALRFADGKPQGAPDLVKPDIGNVFPLGITKAGVLYTSIVASDQDIEVASVDVAAGKQTAPPVKVVQRFAGSNTQPTWSSDGKSLAYTSARGNGFVVVIRATGTDENRELTPALSYLQGLTWSPDGRSFVVFGGDLKGRDGIYRIDAHSGSVTPIVAPIAQEDRLSYEGFFWSPDGKRLYYHSQNGTVHERDLAAGTERVVVAGRPSPITLTPIDGKLGPISLSPDGRWIASYRSEGSGTSVVVVLIPVNGGEPRELLHVKQPEWVNNSSMPWTADGRGILVRKMTEPEGATSELWLVPIDGTTSRKLDFDANRVVPFAQGKLQLHPDGRQLAFVAGHQRIMEVWALENFVPTLKASR